VSKLWSCQESCTLHTTMSALASSELGCSLRGRNSWRIGCINMVAPIGSLQLIKYILFRGTRPMASLGPMSNIMHRAVLSQDAIGWREFMEGKVSKEIAAIQDAHCVISPCHMNGTDRIKHFISHLLHISHSQWIVVTSLCMTNCPLSTQTGGCAQGIRLSD
jgi:hypothetical protein